MKNKTTLWKNYLSIAYVFGGFILIIVAMNGYFLDTNNFPIPTWVILATMGHLLFFTRHEVYLDHQNNQLVRRLRCVFLIKELKIPLSAIQYIEQAPCKFNSRKKGKVNLVFLDGTRFPLLGSRSLYKAEKIIKKLAKAADKPIKTLQV